MGQLGLPAGLWGDPEERKRGHAQKLEAEWVWAGWGCCPDGRTRKLGPSGGAQW